MAKLTKKIILASVVDVLGVKPEYIDLQKFEGEYYWSGKAGSLFSSPNTYYRNLNDVPLDWWVQHASNQTQEALEISGKYSDLNKLIDSIDWSVD